MILHRVSRGFGPAHLLSCQRLARTIGRKGRHEYDRQKRVHGVRVVLFYHLEVEFCKA